ncbi:unnamed protein product, partial [Soboliphyme baturini]|uniref:E3 ubiquitin-protein ligase listerin n=1 Tax=Soboliphyme baturini TaxID=241478 RepID=A0A183IWM5_9BILA
FADILLFKFDEQIVQQAAIALIKKDVIPFCYRVLDVMLGFWNSYTEEKSGPSGILTVRTSATLPDFSPFFLKQYVREHFLDIFESYQQLITEMALRLPYQLLMLICGSKENYRMVRDVNTCGFHIRAVLLLYKRFLSPSASTSSISPSPPNYSFLNEMVQHLKTCIEIASSRIGSWQQYCAQNLDYEKFQFSRAAAQTIAEFMFAPSKLPLMTKFLKRFLLECNTSERRWQTHYLMQSIFDLVQPETKTEIYQLFWNKLWPEAIHYGRKSIQLVDLLGHFSTILPNAVDVMKLATLKMDALFTTTCHIIKLISSHEIFKIILKISDIRRTKMVKKINVYYSNKTVASAVELKVRLVLLHQWSLAKRCDIAHGQTEVRVEFAVPFVACNLKLEYADFYDTTPSISESLHCPRCTASVQPNPGICSNCGENVYQCHKCR